MKVEWEPKDIVCGRRFGKPGLVERQIIGFAVWIDDLRRYVTVSLDDGMTQQPLTKEDLAKWLTDGGYLPAEIL